MEKAGSAEGEKVKRQEGWRGCKNSRVAAGTTDETGEIDEKNEADESENL